MKNADTISARVDKFRNLQLIAFFFIWLFQFQWDFSKHHVASFEESRNHVSVGELFVYHCERAVDEASVLVLIARES